MHTMIQYRLKAECLEDHLDLLAAVFAEMALDRPSDLHYAVHQLEDPLDFVHLVQGPNLPNPLPRLSAFQRFRSGLEQRCDEPPLMTNLHEVGSFSPGGLDSEGPFGNL